MRGVCAVTRANGYTVQYEGDLYCAETLGLAIDLARAEPNTSGRFCESENAAGLMVKQITPWESFLVDDAGDVVVIES